MAAAGRPVVLTATAYALLFEPLTNADLVVTHRQLLQRIRGRATKATQGWPAPCCRDSAANLVTMHTIQDTSLLNHASYTGWRSHPPPDLTRPCRGTPCGRPLPPVFAPNQAASLSRCVDLEDRPQLTPKGARNAGRARLPGRVPYIPFAINSDSAGLVRHVRGCSIDRRDPVAGGCW